MTAVRTVIVGCVEFSQHMYQSAKLIDDIQIVAIITRASSTFNSDFISLENYAKADGIPVFLAEGGCDTGMKAFIKESKVEFGLCVGWSYLLSPSILNSVKFGFVGYHPADLPNNRGRHPLIWALALGLKTTASTFFKMEEKADVGSIIHKQEIIISDTDDASILYEKIIQASKIQLPKFIPSFLKGEIKLEAQNIDEGNHWRKRSHIDGRIDWRMNFEAIYNLVRALSHPYPGATGLYCGQDICIWKVRKGPEYPAFLEPGKILEVNNNEILVKCWDGTILITLHDFNELPKVGEYFK